MQVHSQVLHDIQLQISSYLPTAMLQNDLRAHFTNKEKPWFLITQRAKADRIHQLQSSLKSPQLHSRGSRQPQSPCCPSHPLFDVPGPQLLKAPFTHSQDAVPCYIHSTQPTWWWYPLMSCEAHLEAIQEPPNHTAPIQKGHIQALPPWGGDRRISVRGTSFTAFLYKSESLLPTVPR